MKVRFAVSPGGRTFDPTGLIDFAVTAERLGFDTIWLSDVPMAPIGDPLVSLAHLAGITTRLKLGANLVPLGRNPMLLARQLAQLDQFSAGRLLLTFVPGLDQPGERRALGLPSGDRGVLVEGIIDQLRGWWSGQVVDDIEVAPRPAQDPLEVWLGGIGPKALDRAGRYADGWLTASATPDEAARGRDVILATAERAGRTIDVEHFGISVPYARDTVPAESLAALRARRKDDDLTDIVPVGAEELTKLLQRHIDAGLSKFVLRPLDPKATTADLAWMADAVLSLQT